MLIEKCNIYIRSLFIGFSRIIQDYLMVNKNNRNNSYLKHWPNQYLKRGQSNSNAMKELIGSPFSRDFDLGNLSMKLVRKFLKARKPCIISRQASATRING